MLKKNRQKGTKWQGPRCIVGLQGTNAWVAVGGRCMLVAGEYLKQVDGDERWYGEPDIQKTIALFKGVNKGTTYDDLTGQKGPKEDEVDVNIDELFGLMNADEGPRDNAPPKFPSDLVKQVCGGGGGGKMTLGILCWFQR